MCMTQGSTNTPFRGGKCSIWEGGTRGTAFIGGGLLPGSVAGKPFPHLMHAVDWLPTLASLAGVTDSSLSNVTNLPLDGVNQADNLRQLAEDGLRKTSSTGSVADPAMVRQFVQSAGSFCAVSHT